MVLVTTHNHCCVNACCAHHMRSEDRCSGSCSAEEEQGDYVYSLKSINSALTAISTECNHVL